MKGAAGLPGPSSAPGVAKGLTREQREKGVAKWLTDRVRAAANRTGPYKNIDDTKRLEAKKLLDELQKAPDIVSGNLIQVNLSSGTIEIKPWL